MIELLKMFSFVGWKVIPGKKLSGAAAFRAMRRGNDLARPSNAFERQINAAVVEPSKEVILSCRL